jgi:hypothetical protein
MARFGAAQSVLALAVVTAFAASAQAQAFIPGDLVVTRLDNNGAVLVNSGNSIHLDQYTTAPGQVAPVSSLAVPSTGPNAMVLSTTQTEGELRLSLDDSQLSFFGYNVAAGGPNDVRKLTNRTDLVGAVSASGVLSYPNSTIDAFNPLDAGSHQIRAAYTVDNKNYYISGDDGGNTLPQSGLRYLQAPGPGPTASVEISTSAPQARFTTTGPDGNLYAYVKGGAGGYASAIVNLGVNPTTNNAAPPIALPQGTGAFAFNAVDAFAFVTFHSTPGLQAGDLLYLSDDGLGLLKYQYNGTIWLQDGANTVSGFFSLGMTAALAPNGKDVDIYAIKGTGGSALLSFVDTNAQTSTPASFGALGFATLATAATNDAFRGVSFAPVPEPTSLTLLGLGAACATGLLIRRRRKAA